MKFTLKWLQEYLDTTATCEDICDNLTQIGLEVEEVVDKAGALRGFDCVSVEEVKRHPESDHLNICKVRTAQGELLQIICGAHNVASGVKAVLARTGSVIPATGLKLTKSKMLGVESQGMLCSEKELGLGDDHAGILLLAEDVPLGTNVATALGIDDILIDIAITPNRGDCLGVYGIARELAAAGLGKLKPFEKSAISNDLDNPFKVAINDDSCKEFAIRCVKGVKNCESPAWLKEKISAVGFTPKSALVDITNFVMWVLNRPMHCYDADKIKGDFVIKKSVGGESYVALDRNEYKLPPDTTLICDTHSNTLGLAGIVGGLSTATDMNTMNIVLECAVFDPISIARTARVISINTDAKYRFERGIDSMTTDLAMDYATKLILEICGGEPSKIERVKTPSEAKKSIEFPLSIVPTILGIDIAKERILQILTGLGYMATDKGDTLSLLAPSWRNDITIKENVVEDIIRIYGYNNLLPIEINDNKIGEDDVNRRNRDWNEKLWQANKLLAANGMIEVITWGFVNEKDAADFFAINDKLRLINPMSEDMAYMRPTMLPNMLNIVHNNNDRGVDNISIFENGIVFLGPEPENQKRVIAGIRTGLTCEKDAFGASRQYDIYDVKKDLYGILEIFGINAENLNITTDFPDYYHPTRSGAIKIGNVVVGVFGEVHPLKVSKFKITRKVNAFELYLDHIPKSKPKPTQRKKFVPNDLQSIRRDFAFIVNRGVEVGQILSSIKKIDKGLIKEVVLFDVYQGKNIDADKKSIAFSVKIQPVEKTLTTEEIDTISTKIIREVEGEWGGELRDG